MQALDQFGGQLVGLAAAGAVADGHQIHAVRRAQAAQRVQRAFPVAPRLERVDGFGGQHTAGGIDHRHLAAGANARIQPHHHARAGRRGQQQIAQVLGEHLDRHALGFFAQAGEQVALEAQAQLDLPAPGYALADQVVGGALGVAPAQVHRDATLGHRHRRRRLARRRGGRSRGFITMHQLRVEQLERAAAKHRQRTVRGHLADRLGVVEVIAKLGHVGVVGVLAVEQAALQPAVFPQPFTQAAHQHRVFGPALGQDVAHAVEHGQRIGKTGLGQRGSATFKAGDEGRGLGQRVERRVGEQPLGQRLDAGFASDHGLGAALLFERQIEVFKLLLGGRGLDRGAQLGRELALLFDALEHGRTALGQFAQVGQAGLELAQLDVVEVVGHFLAVAGDEGHGGAAIEQFDRRMDLGRPNLQLGGNLKQDGVQGRRPRDGAKEAGNRVGSKRRGRARLRGGSVCHRGPGGPSQNAPAGAHAAGQTRREQVAAGGRFPVDHLAGTKDTRQGLEHQAFIKHFEAHAACAADGLVDGPGRDHMQRQRLDGGGQLPRVSHHLAWRQLVQ